MAPTLGTADWLVIVGYFLVLALVVAYAARNQRSAADYFLAGRNIGFFAIGASLFASNIGSEHIVGLAGQGVHSGMAMAHYELHSWIILLLAWVFVPFYYRAGVYTMPEFIERRFGPTARWILSVVSLVAYIFTKVSVTVYAGAMVFQALLPDTFGSPENAFWVGAVSTVLLTGIYTTVGGLRAVLYTDTVQTGVLLFGSAAITLVGLSHLPDGWATVREVAAASAESFSLWRPNSDPNFPWLGILIASPVVGIWYWCTDQYIVQRTLAAKDLRTARRGALWGAFLKLWPVFIFLIPGLIGYALHVQGTISLPIREDGVIDGDLVFPTMVATLLPVGLRGLVVAGLLAALMSSLSTLFNSTATLFTIDIYEKLNPRATERQLVRIGRIVTGVVVALGLLWIPIMRSIAGGGLYLYLQSVQSYLAPPITAIFLLGLFWKRINATGAVAGLATGFILGMGKLALEAMVGSGVLTSGVLHAIGEYNFLFASGWLFALSVLVAVVASHLTAPQPEEQIRGLTYAAITDRDREEIRASWSAVDVLATVVVIAIIAAIYLYFSFWI